MGAAALPMSYLHRVSAGLGVQPRLTWVRFLSWAEKDCDTRVPFGTTHGINPRGTAAASAPPTALAIPFQRVDPGF